MVINSYKLYLLGVLLLIFVAFLGELHVLIVKINHDYDKLENRGARIHKKMKIW